MFTAKVRKMKRNILMAILILLFLQGCGYTFVPADRWRNTQANLAQCKKELTECKDVIEDEHFLCVWGDILVNYKTYKEVIKLFKEENPDFILVTNYVDDPYKGGAIYCDGNYCIDYIEKPTKGKAGSNLNNCGIFIFSREIFDVLELIEPSKRGEIEIPDAICHGINERNWMVRVYKIPQDQFRGDFGDVDEYERLKEDSEWLKTL